MKFMTYVAGVNLDRYAETVVRQRRLRDRRNNSATKSSEDPAKAEPEPNAIESAALVAVEESSKLPEPAAKPPTKPEDFTTSTKCKRRGSITVESDSDADISASISIKGSSKSSGSKSVRFQDEEEGPKSILKKTSEHVSFDNGFGCVGECKKGSSQDSCVQDPTSNKQRNVSKKNRGFDNKTSEGLLCSCDTATKPPNNFPSHTRDNKQPQKHAQKYSDFIRGHNPNMSRLIHPSRAEVIIREDVVESPTDPRPNAFFDSRTGTLRVYHGPVYGNPFSTLVPIQAAQFPIGANAHQPYPGMASGMGGTIGGGAAYRQGYQPGALAAATSSNSPCRPVSQGSTSPSSAHSSSTAKGNQHNGNGSAQDNNYQTPWSGDGWGDDASRNNVNKDDNNNSGNTWGSSNDNDNNNSNGNSGGGWGSTNNDNNNSGNAWGSSSDNNNNSNGSSGSGWGSTNNDNNDTWDNSNQNSSSKANNGSSWGSSSAGKSTQQTTSTNNSGWKGTGNETTVSAGSWGDEGGKKDDTPIWGDQSAAQSWGGDGEGGGESGW